MKLVLVAPCYNEEAAVPQAAIQMCAALDGLMSCRNILSTSSAVVVDDGSTDRTWLTIQNAAAFHARVGGIKLSHNRGHQNAVLAGMMTVDADAVITIEVDLQDDDHAGFRLMSCRAIQALRQYRETNVYLRGMHP